MKVWLLESGTDYPENCRIEGVFSDAMLAMEFSKSKVMTWKTREKDGNIFYTGIERNDEWDIPWGIYSMKLDPKK